MSNAKIFSCYLIGDDRLLIQCAESLLARCHTIIGIISSLKIIAEWAKSKDINFYNSIEEAEFNLANQKFDYLFSIINSQVLPAYIINRPLQFAINYHDSPLPRYAGRHATCWAIINNEKNHGISWHIMNDRIDAGDILKQFIFPIDSNETSLSLNLKCYQYAVQGFGELIDELASQSFNKVQQDLTARTYYAFNKKPPGNAWISWDNSAEQIDRICRALHFGKYSNGFSVAKISIGSKIYVIDEWKIGVAQSNEAPGTIIKLIDNEWQIATATKNLILLKIRTQEGNLCELKNVAEEHHLKEYSKLVTPSSELLTKLELLSTEYFQKESFWVKELINFDPAVTPFLNLANFEASELTDSKILVKSKIAVSRLFLSKDLFQKLYYKFHSQSSIVEVIIATWVIYLYFLGNEENLGFGLYHQEFNHTPIEFSPFFAQILPFYLGIDPAKNFAEFLKLVQTKLKALKENLSYDRSLIQRYPLLERHNKFPFVVVIVTDRPEQILSSIDINYFITLAISTDGRLMTWYVGEELIKKTTDLVSVVKNFPGHFNNLLRSILSNDPIAGLNFIPKKQLEKILYRWNQTVTKFSKDKTLAQLFEEIAIKYPKKIAIAESSKMIAYNQLNKMANQFARYLQKKGLGSGMTAIVCSGHDLQLIVSILAIIKLGATYIPIDPTIASRRLHFIFEDSNPSLMIISKSLNKRVNKILPIEYIEFECCKKHLEKEEDHNLNLKLSSKNIAYIIYTSGTTGEPKGIMVPQYAITRLVTNTNYIKILPRDRILQAACISFDAATFEIWGALLNGACLVGVSHDHLLDPIYFGSILKIQKISILWLTSALFDQFALVNPGMFRKLKYLLVGGDVLNKETIRNVLECKEGAPKYMLNGYGPSENTTFSTTYLITKKDIHRQRIPIGKPIANTQVYVLNSQLKPMPIGVPGELYLGGDGLSYGYINKKELTKIKFIPNLFNKDGSKLYKTGDIVYWLPNGNLDFIGRKDNQVKIRGYRVELEAIKIQLLQYQNISQCFVHIIEDTQKNKFLFAYLVKESGTRINLNKVKSFLSERLPVYMMPDRLIVIDKIPLTENGKIDYPVLAKLAAKKRLIKSEDYPKSELEVQIAKFWCELLNLSEVSIVDNFFDLGGHSLLLTKLLLFLKDKLNLVISLQAFLANPTINYLVKNAHREINTGEYLPFYNANIKKDLYLDLSINLNKVILHSSEVKSVLLTGATGFLGVHLLSDLCRLTTSKIFCLVRADSISEAFNKLRRVVTNYQLDVSLEKRVEIVLGDIAKPCLGLSTNEFYKLANEIDYIYHNAAHVNHLYNYDTLRNSNVLSTIEILKLAAFNKIKSISFVSTLSAVDVQNIENYDFLKNATNYHQLPINIKDGYSQTKLVSEILLSQAIDRGFSVKIFRPGWIMGQQKTGIVSANNNHLLLLLKGCIQMGYAPNWKVNINMLPVDYVSRLIVNCSMSKTSKKIFNLVNPHIISWTMLVKMLEEIGFSVKIISAGVWKKKYLQNITSDNALYNLLPLYMNSHYNWVEDLDRLSTFNASFTNKYLDFSELNYPKIDRGLIKKYFYYLIESQFFPLKKNALIDS